MNASSAPTVSIILPTYNRARFLPEAVAAIRDQQFTDWELIVVDDGSTDETSQLIPKLCDSLPQPWRLVRQDNCGAYSARNTGLDYAQGQYVAFYDSDDLWLRHHLRDCVAALVAHPKVDWVYGASRIVDLDSGRVTSENCFYMNGKPRGFLLEGVCEADGLRVFTGLNGVCTQIAHGLYCGLQGSVMRRELFQTRRLPTGPVAESIGDQLIAIECLRAGAKLGCLDRVHFDYRVHDANTCAAGAGPEQVARRIRVYEAAIRGKEDLLNQPGITPREASLLRRTIAADYFWQLGYAAHWNNGDYPAAFAAFHRALRLDPLRLAYWKTYLAAIAKQWFLMETL